MFSHHSGYIGRKMRLPDLMEKPAIVIAAFGSSSGAQAALENFSQQVADEFEEYRVFWAWTSEIIRKKLGLPGLKQVLSEVESEGYRKAVVQPLHIFPGTEYSQLFETCASFPGIRLIVGETLLHRWDFVEELLQILEREFLPQDAGINVLAIHGTPLSAEPVNAVYLGLEQMVRGIYPNVYVAAVEGVPSFRAMFETIKRERDRIAGNHVKIIPVMFFAGLHAQDDLMGDHDSWRSSLEGLGFSVSMPSVEGESGCFYKGLCWYREVNDFFVSRIRRSLELARYF